MATKKSDLHKQDLNIEEFQRFQFEYQQKQRKLLATYLLWAFLGMIGAHEMYLHDQKWLKIRYYSLVVLGVLIVSVISTGETETMYLIIPTILILCLVALKTYFWDLFFIPEYVKARNKQIEKEIIADLRGIDLKEHKKQEREKKKSPFQKELSKASKKHTGAWFASIFTAIGGFGVFGETPIYGICLLLSALAISPVAIAFIQIKWDKNYKWWHRLIVWFGFIVLGGLLG